MGIKKNGDINNNPKLIIILGIIFFVLGSVFSVLSIVKTTEAWAIIVALAILIIGVVIIVYGVLRCKAVKALKVLSDDNSAYITNANFIKAKFASYSLKTNSINGIPFKANARIFKKVIYSYTDQNGEFQTVKSAISYASNQVEYLQNLKSFKIKCDGKRSIIIEDIPDAESDVKF